MGKVRQKDLWSLLILGFVEGCVVFGAKLPGPRAAQRTRSVPCKMVLPQEHGQSIKSPLFAFFFARAKEAACLSCLDCAAAGRDCPQTFQN